MVTRQSAEGGASFASVPRGCHDFHFFRYLDTIYCSLGLIKYRAAVIGQGGRLWPGLTLDCYHSSEYHLAIRTAPLLTGPGASGINEGTRASLESIGLLAPVFSSRISSMHRALEVNEILDNVLCQLDACSQARALHVVSNSTTFDDLRAYEEWRRFQLYSALIRSLDLTIHNAAGPVAKFLQKMVMYSHDTTVALFPQLRSLKATAFNSTDLAWVQLLLCPSLVSFELRGYDYNNQEPHSSALLAFLASLSRHAPALTHAVFAVNDIPTQADWSRQVDEALKYTQAKLQHLRSLGCMSSFAFGQVGLESLARLPRLSELTISGNRELVKRDEIESLPVSLDLCPNLLRIHFGAANLARAAHFLECLPATLQEIELLSIETNGDAITRFVRACARFKLLRGFKLIQHQSTYLDTLLLHNGTAGYHPISTLQLEWFSPLAECAEMKVFQILLGDGGVACTVDDDHLACFVESWPELGKFELRPSVLSKSGQRHNEESSLRPPCMITQRSLLAFASRCRKLRSLRLPWVDVHSFDNDRIPNPGLALVDLGFQLGAGDTSRVQDLVRRIWPNATVAWNPQYALMSTSGVEYEDNEEEVEEGADEYNFVEELGEEDYEGYSQDGDMYDEFD